jgi:hypothetical protein
MALRVADEATGIGVGVGIRSGHLPSSSSKPVGCFPRFSRKMIQGDGTSVVIGKDRE